MRPTLMAICSLFLLISGTSYSQEDYKLAAIDLKSFITGEGLYRDYSNREIIKESMSTKALQRLTDVPSKLSASFTNDFKGAAGAEWFCYDKKGKRFLVKFYNDNKECRALYNKNGHVFYSVGERTEKDLTPVTKRIIRFSYGDYNIVSVVEVNSYNQKALIINLKNTDEIVAIRIEDNMIEELGQAQFPREHVARKQKKPEAQNRLARN